MLQQLILYRQKINSHEDQIRSKMSNFQQSLIQQFSEYIKQMVKYHYEHRYIHKSQVLTSELATIQYYISARQNESNNEQQSIKQLNSINLYSLFKQIDDKLDYNISLLLDISINWAYPRTRMLSQYDSKQYLINKCDLLDEKIQQLYGLLHVQNPDSKLKSVMKKVEAVFDRYRDCQKNILFSNQKQNAANIKLNVPTLMYICHYCSIKNTPAAICLCLSEYKYLNQIDMCILGNAKGKIDIQNYDKIFQSISSRNRLTLKTLKIKIMDMQFCQQKCDTIKRKLKNLKYLKNFTIHNYYAECKLGHFAKDFNWKPFRQGVHVGTKIWR